MPDIKAAIEANAAEIKRLHSLIHETLRHRYKSPEQTERWKTACAEFHARYDKLAFPDGLLTAKERIRSGDTDAIEAALCFVELRPYFFRSGYMFGVVGCTKGVNRHDFGSSRGNFRGNLKGFDDSMESS